MNEVNAIEAIYIRKSRCSERTEAHQDLGQQGVRKFIYGFFTIYLIYYKKVLKWGVYVLS